MAYEFINDCNGCPDCHGCGRNTRRLVSICDYCGEQIYNSDNAYQVHGQDLCGDCAQEYIAENPQDFLQFLGEL